MLARARHCGSHDENVYRLNRIIVAEQSWELMRKAAQECRMDFLNGLDPRPAIDVLLSRNGLTSEQAEEIRKATRREGARMLLDTVLRKGPEIFHVFLEAVKEENHWIYKCIEERLEKLGLYFMALAHD